MQARNKICPRSVAKTLGLATLSPCPSDDKLLNLKDSAMHVDPRVENLRTRVQFPPPPPIDLPKTSKNV